MCIRDRPHRRWTTKHQCQVKRWIIWTAANRMTMSNAKINGEWTKNMVTAAAVVWRVTSQPLHVWQTLVHARLITSPTSELHLAALVHDWWLSPEHHINHKHIGIHVTATSAMTTCQSVFTLGSHQYCYQVPDWYGQCSLITSVSINEIPLQILGKITPADYLRKEETSIEQ